MNTGDDALDSFTAKWRQRWPEWTIAEAFVPPAQRDAAVAWFALLQELADAAWSGADPTPGLAKLAWWQEELRGWAKGARRHPLAGALRGRPVAWNDLADAMGGFRARAAVDGDVDAALVRLAALGGAVAGIERQLFDGGMADPHAVSAALLAPWLASEAVRGDALLAHWPAGAGGTRPRRVFDAVARARLARAVRGQGPAPRWDTLWRAWRAARN